MSDDHVPPYFNLVFARLQAGDEETVRAFGRHVHWGFWPQPADLAGRTEPAGTAADYAEAAERLCQRVCSAAGVADGDRLLDVGCGFGGTLASLDERHTGLSMYGLNIDRRQLVRAREVNLTPTRGANRCALVHGDAHRLPFADASFDVVLAVECVFHFDRARFLAEASRVLRSGGTLAVSDFVPPDRLLEYLDSYDLNADEAVRWSYGELDLTYSPGRYQQAAAAAGLSLVSDDDITAGTLPTYEYLLEGIERWPAAADRERFTRATKLLEKLSRKGMVAYRVMSFRRQEW